MVVAQAMYVPADPAAVPHNCPRMHTLSPNMGVLLQPWRNTWVAAV